MAALAWGGGALAATEWNLPTIFCGGEGAPTPFAIANWQPV